MGWLQKITQDNRGETLESILSRWKAQGVTIFCFEQEHRIVLSTLIIPKGKRKQGIGSQIMQELTDYADQVGKRLETTPGEKDRYHGTTSRRRLINFYKRFGFVSNKGRNKDFRTRETMLREPKKNRSRKGIL